MIKYLSKTIYWQLILRFGLLLVSYTIARVLFFAFNYDYFSSVTFQGFITILRGGIVFDTAAILYTNIVVILMSVVPFRFKYKAVYQKVLHALFLVFNLIALFINLADTVYYRFTLKRTTATIFNEFGNDDNIAQIIVRSFWDYWPVTLAGISLIALFIYLSKLIKQPECTLKSNWRFYISQTLMMVLIMGLFVGGVRGGFAESTRPITLSNASKYIENVNERALVLNTPFAIIRTIGNNPLSRVNLVSEDTLKAHYSAVHPAHQTKGTLGMDKPNVVIIILESFGRGHLAYFNQDIPGFKSFTPFLDSLSQHSYVFHEAYANGRKSIDAMPSIIASIPSVKEPFVLSTYSGNKLNSIPSILGKEGYYSAFFHGAPNGSMGFDAFAKQAGFVDYFGKDEFNDDSQFDGTWGIWDEPFMQFYADKMGTFKEPFVTTLFSVSSHSPFAVPTAYEDILPHGELPIKKCLAYTDIAIKNFFQNCKQQSWYDNTIFVIVADHASHNLEPRYKTTAGSFAIPILFYTPNPDLLVGNDSTTNIQQIDIMPTLMGMIGVKQDYIAFGSDVFDDEQPHFAFNYRDDIYQAIRNNYLLQFEGKKGIALYNLANDPLQKTNIIQKDTVVAEKLELLIKCIFQEYSNRLIDNKLTIDE